MRTGYFQAKTARYGAGRRWRCRYLDPDGKERSKSFERRADAERFRSQAAADVARGTYVDPGAGRMTLRTYAEGWLKGWHPYSGRGEKVRSHLELHILPGLGGHTLAQLTPTAVRQWLAGLPLAPGAARQVFITLSAVLSAAVDDGRLARNPCKAKSVQAPSQPHQKIIPWTAAQVRAVRSELPERYRAMADCGAGLGLRQGEVLGLAVDAVDFLRHEVHVRRQVKRVAGRLWFALPKGGREGKVPLPETVALALAAHIVAYPPAEVTLPWHEPGARRHGQMVAVPLLFVTPGGRELHPATLNSGTWCPARQRAGAPADGMHALRHHYASVLLAGGVDIRALSEYLGHHDAGFTLMTYCHLVPEAGGRAGRPSNRPFLPLTRPQPRPRTRRPGHDQQQHGQDQRKRSRVLRRQNYAQ